MYKEAYLRDKMYKYARSRNGALGQSVGTTIKQASWQSINRIKHAYKAYYKHLGL